MYEEMLITGATYFVAIALPGPSISLIIRNGLLFSKKASISASIGIMVGIAIQSALVLFSLNIMNVQSYTYYCLRLICACFLMILGIKSIISIEDNYLLHKNILSTNAFCEGLLLEILNPIALIFFFTLLSNSNIQQSIWHIKLVYWLEIIIIGCGWFGSLALLFSSTLLIKNLQKYKKQIGRIAGISFMAYGIKSIIDLLSLSM